MLHYEGDPVLVSAHMVALNANHRDARVNMKRTSKTSVRAAPVKARPVRQRAFDRLSLGHGQVIRYGLRRRSCTGAPVSGGRFLRSTEGARIREIPLSEVTLGDAVLLLASCDARRGWGEGKRSDIASS